MGDAVTRRSILVLAGAIVVLAVSLFFAASHSSPSPAEVKSQQEQERIEVVWACRYVWKPIVAAVHKVGIVQAGQQRRDIEQSKGFERSGLYGRLFPLPPRELHALLSKSRGELRTNEHEIRRALKPLGPLNCEGIFPPN